MLIKKYILGTELKLCAFISMLEIANYESDIAVTMSLSFIDNSVTVYAYEDIDHLTVQGIYDSQVTKQFDGILKAAKRDHRDILEYLLELNDNVYAHLSGSLLPTYAHKLYSGGDDTVQDFLQSIVPESKNLLRALVMVFDTLPQISSEKLFGLVDTENKYELIFNIQHLPKDMMEDVFTKINLTSGNNAEYTDAEKRLKIFNFVSSTQLSDSVIFEHKQFTF